MLLSGKSCCAFLHFSENDEIPYYVQIYCNELSKYFDEIVLVSNNKNLDLNKSFSTNIRLWHTENKGYDFGLFYRFLNSINLSEYKTIACINDSNILINTLDDVFKWGNAQKVDMWGMIDSHEKPWFSSHKENYHIQSHFLVFNRNVLGILKSYYTYINVDEIFAEFDNKKLRRLVIDRWEIGLSRYLISKKLKINSFLNSEKLLAKYAWKEKNLTISRYKELVQNEGYPLIKKKALTQKRSWFKQKDNSIKEILLNNGNTNWQLDKLINSCT